MHFPSALPEQLAVTGASGFIGGHLVRALVAAGRLPMLLIPPGETGHPDCPVQLLELNDAGSTADTLRETRPALLYHLAGVRTRSWGQDAAVNVAGTVRLLEAALECGVRRVVIVGSAEEYGRREGPLREDMPPAPVSSYGVSKWCATQFALRMHEVAGLPVVILRPFTVYGPGQPASMFVAQALSCAIRRQPFEMTHGRQRRDLVFVSDVIRALLAAGVAPGVDGRVINVGSGVATPLRDVARMVWELVGAPPELLRIGAREAPPEETHDTWADISVAREALGWRPEVELRAGLEAMLKKAQGSG